MRITFEFVGGPHDGKLLHGVVGEASDAERFLLGSNWGMVGQQFKVASEYAVEMLAEERLQEERRHYFQRHFYVVTDRLDNGEEMWVRAEYLPEAVESSRSSS